MNFVHTVDTFKRNLVLNIEIIIEKKNIELQKFHREVAN